MAYTIKIDLKSQTPVYKQLISNVETAIHDGEYRYGDLLPSMNELSLQLGISKETVKKAYSLMRDKGIISATQGKGFYVSSENSGQKPKILVLFDKLSTYKQVLFSSFSSTIGTQGEITIRLHNQQVELLEYYIDENLDLSVIAQEGNASRNQAKRIIKAFFSSYTPRDFTITHTAEKANMKYALGNLSAGGENFTVTIFITTKGDGYKIQQFKIEKM